MIDTSLLAQVAENVGPDGYETFLMASVAAIVAGLSYVYAWLRAQEKFQTSSDKISDVAKLFLAAKGMSSDELADLTVKKVQEKMNK